MCEDFNNEKYQQELIKWNEPFGQKISVTDEEWSREFAKIMEKIKKANEKEGCKGTRYHV